MRRIALLLALGSCTAEMTPEETFWSWFGANSMRLFEFEKDQDRVFAELGAAMKNVHADLTFEFGPVEDGRREFIISAGGIKEAFPTVRRLHAAAPAMKEWTFIAFRPRRSAEFEVTFGDLTINAESIWFRPEYEDGKVHVVLYIRGYDPKMRDTFFQIAFLQLDTALGEYDVEMKLGGIDLAPLPADPAKAGLRPFAELPATVDSLTSGR